jgi:septal ring factor EnvC (AmiA/AmiB activator)
MRFQRSLLVMALVLAGTGGPSHAQDARPPEAIERERAERQRELEALGEEIRLGDDQLRRLQGEIETLRRDREEITRRVVEVARALQRSESEASAGEARIRALGAEETRLRAALAQRRAVIAELLATLQRIGRHPPPALVVEPEGALSAVRSAILLGAVLPELRGEADRVVADLSRLLTVQRQTTAEVERLRGQLTAMAEQRTRLELLVEEKNRGELRSEEEIARTRARAQELARDAGSLRDLVARIDREIMSARRAADAARAESARQEAAARQEATRREEESRILALREAERPENRTLAALPNPGRLAPAIAFDRTRGLLPLPASGEVLRNYGEDDGIGGTHRGLSLATRAGAAVTVPADGWVVYAGPFRAYGQLVIVNAGDGYHILLAGMERITVSPGQFVLAGEPVARMGARMLSPATAIDIGSDRPVLYVEFRKDGQTIDPGPWWAETAMERARG